jgi:hypothetical protein
MEKQDRVEDVPAAAGEGTGEPVVGGILPKMALASIAGPEMGSLRIDGASLAGMEQTAAIEAPRIDLAAARDVKIDLATIEAPHIAPEMADLKPSAEETVSAPLVEEADVPEPPSVSAPTPRVNRFALLAACLALAAGLGGMVGALGAYALVRPQPTQLVATGKLGTEEIQALKENVVQARVELAALKASFDAGNRNATTQLGKVTERIERMERTAAEPAARINKAIENFERLARAEGVRAGEVTGSITPAPAAPGRPAALEGWVLRDVHRGTAFLEGRSGVMEVEQGDMVPGLGRIDAIRKQDGRWVVVTSRGTITMR